MINLIDYLQLFGEGGDAGGAEGTAEAEGSTSGVAGQEETTPPEDLDADFENLIKGKYKSQYDARVQKTINKRFKGQKETESKLNKSNQIMQRIADRYGVDVNDYDALAQAFDDDASYLERQALENGLTVKQQKEINDLRRTNQLLTAEKQQQEADAAAEEIYNGWMQQTEDFQNKYGIQLDLAAELDNPDFERLISHNVSVEAAYIALHPDQMIGGAMAVAARETKKATANNIASRNSRPSESGISRSNAKTLTTDVEHMSQEQLIELYERAKKGETIYL